MKDQLIYHGKVKITILNTDRVSIKTNKGTKKLFNFFARALCDASVISNAEYPASIDLIYEIKNTDDSVTIDSYLFAPRPITRALIQDTEGNLAVRLTGKISKSNMKSEPELIKISRLELRLKDRDGVELASIPVDIADIEAIDTGRQALIQWDLSVGNPSDIDPSSSNSK